MSPINLPCKSLFKSNVSDQETQPTIPTNGASQMSRLIKRLSVFSQVSPKSATLLYNSRKGGNLRVPEKEKENRRSADAAAFYVTSGTLLVGSASYVSRQADTELYAHLKRGEFCYALNTRQMGKSSLMVRTARRLRGEGFPVAVLDLTAVGQNLTADQWYDGLLLSLGQQIGLEDALEDFYLDSNRLGPMQRFFEAIRTIALPALKRNADSDSDAASLIIFVDEIDAVRSLPFSADEFFLGIREAYNRRADDTEYDRLTFCLLGTATPADLIQHSRLSPFNIGRRILVTDFTPDEAAPLAAGLGPSGPAVLMRILHWTGGHPNLTQRLCQSVATERLSSPTTDRQPPTTAAVDRLCETMFLTRAARDADDNLSFVRKYLLEQTDHKREDVLDFYAQILAGKRVPDDETNPLCSVLKLSGVAKANAQGSLIVRNRIYRRVFDRAWITESMPDAELRRQRHAAARARWQVGSLAFAIFSAMAFLLWRTVHAEQRANAAAKSESAAARQARAAEARARNAAAEAGDEAAARTTEAKARALSEASARQSERRAKDSETAARADRARAVTAAQDALTQQRFAESETSRALRAEDAARTNESKAQQQATAANRASYTATLSLAQREFGIRNDDRVIELLRSVEKNPNKGIEWRYLYDQTHQFAEEFALPRSRGLKTLAFSPNGKQLCVGTTNEAMLLNSRTDHLQTLLTNPRAEAGNFFSTGDESVVCSSDGKTVVRLNKKTGRLLTQSVTTGRTLVDKPLSGETEMPFWNVNDSLGHAHFAVSPDGGKVAWLIREKTPGSGDISPESDFSPFKEQANFAYIFDASTGKKEFILPLKVNSALSDRKNNDLPYPYHRSEHRIGFLSDRLLYDITTYKNWTSLALYDLTTRTLLWFEEVESEDALTSIALSNNGREIAVGSQDGSVTILTVMRTKIALNASVADKYNYFYSKIDESAIRSLTFSPDDAVIGFITEKGIVKTLTRTPSDNGSSDRLDEAFADASVRTFRGNGAKARFLAFSPDNKQMVALYENGRGIRWNCEEKYGEIVLESRGKLELWGESQDGRFVAAVTTRTPTFGLAPAKELPVRVTVWDVATGGEVPLSRSMRFAFRTFRTGFGHKANANFSASLNTSRAAPESVIAFAPDAASFFECPKMRATEACLRETQSGKILRRLHPASQNIVAASFSPDGKNLVWADERGLTVWDVDAGRVRRFLALPSWFAMSDADYPFDWRFSADSRYLFLKTDDAKKAGIYSLDMDEMKSRPVLMPRRLDLSERWSAIADEQSGRMAFSDSTGVVRLWDKFAPTQGDVVLRGHTSRATAQFSPDKSRVITSSGDGSCRIWNSATGEEVLRIDSQKEFDDAAIAQNNSGLFTVAQASHDSKIRFLKFRSQHSLTAPERKLSLEFASSQALATGQWEKAASALAKLNRQEFLLNRSDYRNYCEMIMRDISNRETNEAFWAVSNCCLRPDGLEDFKVPLRKMEEWKEDFAAASLFRQVQGMVFYRSGRFREAVSLLQKSESGKPDARTQLFLAMAQRHLGQTQRAQRWLALARKGVSAEFAAAANSQTLPNLMLWREAEKLIHPTKP